MAKRKSSNAVQEGKAGSDYIAPDDFTFKAASYDDIKREMVKDNPTASIAIAFAEEAGLGQGAKNTIADISKTLMGEAKDFAIRDAAFWGVEHLNNFVHKALDGSEKGKQAALGIELVTNVGVVAAKPITIAWEVYQEKQEKLDEFYEKIDAFTQAYGKQKDNKIIEKSLGRIDKESHSRDTEIMTSAALGTAQAFARKVHSDQIGEKINAKLTTELESIPNDNQKARDALTQEAEKILAKPRLQTVDLFANNQLGEKGSKFSERAFENQQLNMTTGIMAAGAFGASQLEKVTGEEGPSKHSIIAADLILYLDEQMKSGDMKDGKIHFDALKQQYPNLPKEWGNSMELEQFVEVIFNTHVHDQTGETIPPRFHPKLKEISHEIADAMLHPSSDLTSEATLHPLALIDLVGSGKLVGHDGLHVTSLSEAKEEIATAINIMPLLPQMDTVRYLQELGSSYKLPPDDMGEQLKDQFRGMDKETRDFVALLVPSQVLINELGVDATPLNESRQRASEYALDNFKQIISEMAEKSDASLLSDEGLTRKQIQHIRDAAAHIEAGNDEALLHSLRNRDADSVAFAVLSAKDTMQELADGKRLVGYDALQAEKEKEAISTEALQKHADNAHKREERDAIEGVGNSLSAPEKEKPDYLKDILHRGKQSIGDVVERIKGDKEEALENGASRAEIIAAQKMAEQHKERTLAG
jgi:hypothetical protein